MVDIPADPQLQKPWQIRAHEGSAWRSWAGEIVFYDDFTGDTLKLDVVMAEIFRRLLQAPATQAQLTDHLATTLDLEADMRLEGLAAIALERLNQAGLIESAARSWSEAPA